MTTNFNYQNIALAQIVGMFDAAPGAVYLNQFANTLASGTERLDLATTLVQTDQFRRLYSDSDTNDLFATEYIDRLVGSTVSDVHKSWAIDWLTNKLNGGDSKSSVMLDAIDELQGVDFDNLNWGQAAQFFANKINVAAEYSMIHRNSAASLDDLRAVLSEVTADPTPINGEVIFSLDFENRDLGEYTREEQEADMQRTGKLDNHQHMIEQMNNDNMLKVTLPQGELKKGLQSYINFDQDHEALSLRFDIRFGDGFDWAAGGKLPGLSGVAENSNNATGEREPLALEDGYDAFSLRSMYREDGRQVQYRYDIEEFTQDDAYLLGDEAYSFETGVTYEFEQWVIVNNPGAHNGIVMTWINGQLVAARNDYLLRSSDNYGINKLLVDIWAGGKENNFRPSVDSHVFIDDLLVQTLADYDDLQSALNTDSTLSESIDSNSNILASELELNYPSTEVPVEMPGIMQADTTDLF